jgi:hypothetical protein
VSLGYHDPTLPLRKSAFEGLADRFDEIFWNGLPIEVEMHNSYSEYLHMMIEVYLASSAFCPGPIGAHILWHVVLKPRLVMSRIGGVKGTRKCTKIEQLMG